MAGDRVFRSPPSVLARRALACLRFGGDGTTRSTFDPTRGREEKLLISTGGGTDPVWSPDGRELFYRNGRAMMAVSIETEPSFSASRPELLFTGPYLSDVENPGTIKDHYDILSVAATTEFPQSRRPLGAYALRGDVSQRALVWMNHPRAPAAFRRRRRGQCVERKQINFSKLLHVIALSSRSI